MTDMFYFIRGSTYICGRLHIEPFGIIIREEKMLSYTNTDQSAELKTAINKAKHIEFLYSI